MSDETGYIVKPATTATDPTPETAIRLQLIWWQQQCYGQEVDIKRLQARVDELEAALERIQIDSDEIIIVAAQTISKYASQALANSEGENHE